MAGITRGRLRDSYHKTCRSCEYIEGLGLGGNLLAALNTLPSAATATAAAAAAVAAAASAPAQAAPAVCVYGGASLGSAPDHVGIRLPPQTDGVSGVGGGGGLLVMWSGWLGGGAVRVCMCCSATVVIGGGCLSCAVVCVGGKVGLFHQTDRAGRGGWGEVGACLLLPVVWVLKTVLQSG